MQIQKATQNDFLAIYELDQEAWKQNHKAEAIPDGSHAWRMWVETSLVYVAKSEGQIIGVALAFPSLDGSFCLHKIFVDVTCRGQGVGSALMDHLLQAIDDLGTSAFLSVDPRNSDAIELYAKFGFRDREFIQAFYGEGEDRYILRRKEP